MLSVIRNDVDFAIRFGGDEFAIILFADYPYACAKARQVLGMMENKVSIGISTIRPDTPAGLTLEQFIHRADDALYEAKHRGRGRVVVDRCPLDDSSGCGSYCQEMPVTGND
jgi:diguanylate cyclase (GGDEF)-like protein